MPAPRKLQVFLCHASQDKSKVRELYQRLVVEPWIDPWLDAEKLLPGQDWNLEIEKALRAADMIIVCLSKEFVSKEGYVQREFRKAVSYAEEKPEGTTYIIPLRLDDCETPYKFQQWQWLDYFATGAQDKLLISLRMRAEKLGIGHGSKSTAGVDTVSKSHPEPTGFTPGGRPFYKFAGMEFVKVPAGDFYMGADNMEDASPQHLIYQLNYDFYIGRYPVTNQEFSLYLRDRERPILIARSQMKLPIANVFWIDADTYIDWLNNMHDTELPTGYIFSLPSESEWEKAARGVDANEYPWGNEFDARRCNSLEGGKKGPTPVGTYSHQGDSAFGAADMAGNVWEWTRSLKRKGNTLYSYPYRFDDGREEAVYDDAEYILRGGSFESNKEEIRCAKRSWLKPKQGSNTISFRVAICPIPK
ncbi:MAG: SUMF1/EgtB/PvdO family nonheme iron enzyme [Anaerolineales bacterium]